MFYRRRSRGFLWIIVIIIAVGLINTPAFKKSIALKIPRAMVINTFYFMQYAAKASSDRIGGIFSDISALRTAQKENRILKEELSIYKARLNVFNELLKDNEILRQSLQQKAASPFRYDLLYAKVVARSASNWFSEIEINKGSADGVQAEMAVIAGSGLVGRVIESKKFSSKVLLITDPASSVSAVNQRSRDMGIVVGGAIGPISLKYVSTSADMRSGDVLVTSGMSGTFPKGVVLGRITSASKKDYDLFQNIIISPAVDFSKLESVFVVKR